MNIKNLRIDKQILLGSILCFVYFAAMILINHYQLETILVGVLKEIITIPFLLLLVALTIAIFWFTYQENKLNKPILIIAFLINTVTVLLLSFVK